MRAKRDYLAFNVVGFTAPEPRTDHAQRAARLALAMRTVVRDVAAARQIELAMRIGMHSGEAVAGVIGIERFASRSANVAPSTSKAAAPSSPTG